jgi:hypothetical protein
MDRLNGDPGFEDGIVVKRVPEEAGTEEIFILAEQGIGALALGLGHFLPGPGTNIDGGPGGLEAVMSAPEIAAFLLNRLDANLHILSGEIAQNGQIA